MGVIIKKCLACGTFNQLEAEECKKCGSSLLAEVDQDDEIMEIDPMEAALNDTVSEIGDDEVAQILRAQAETAKKTVQKEREKEERKKKRKKGNGAFNIGGEGGESASDRLRKSGGAPERFNYNDGSASSSHGFSLGGEDKIDYEKEERKQQKGRKKEGRWGARTGDESSESGSFKIKGV